MTPHSDDRQIRENPLAALEQHRRAHELQLAKQAGSALDRDQARAENFLDAKEKALLLQEIETARHFIVKICETPASSLKQLEAENFRNYLEGTAIGLQHGRILSEVMTPLNVLIDFELESAMDAEKQLCVLADMDFHSRS